MANGVFGNVYYIDTGGVVLDNLKMRIQSISLAATGTTSTLELTLSTGTTQTIYKMTSPDNNPVTLSTYLGGVYFERLFVKTLTAGTGFIYFS